MARDFLPHRSLIILITKSALKSWITTTVHIGSVFLGHDSCNRRFLVSQFSFRFWTMARLGEASLLQGVYWDYTILTPAAVK